IARFPIGCCVVPAVALRRDSSEITSPSDGFRFISPSDGVCFTSSSNGVCLRGSFKFLILTSKNFVKQSSVMDKRFSQILGCRLTPMLVHENFTGFTTAVGVFRVGRRDVRHGMATLR